MTTMSFTIVMIFHKHKKNVKFQLTGLHEPTVQLDNMLDVRTHHNMLLAR
jgi:hypothetical protein